MLRLERIIILKHISAVFGSSSALAFLLLQLYYWSGRLNISSFGYAAASGALVWAVVVMIIRNHRAAEVQDQIVAAWSCEVGRQ